MKKRFLLFFITLITLSSTTFAQSKVSGTVVEEANGKAVPFVNVGLFRQADSVFVSGAT